MTTSVDYTCVKNQSHGTNNNEVGFTIVANDPGAASVWQNGVPTAWQHLSITQSSDAYAAGYAINSVYTFQI